MNDGSRIGGKIFMSGCILDIVNPYSNSVISHISLATRDDMRHAIEVAYKHKFNLTRYERSNILQRTANLLREKIVEASNVITLESGLSKKDTTHEVMRVIDVFEFGAKEVLRDNGQEFSYDLTSNGQNRKGFTVQDPLLGVIAAITPFNHPMNQVAHKIVPSIATNNRMIVKPSEKTPLSALYLTDLLYEAGLPVEMVQVVIGQPEEIVGEILSNDLIELISFTGSVGVGKYIAKNAGYRRLVLEMGGNDPFIIMEDADVEKAARLAVAGSYGNSGQRCTAVKRILVHSSVAAEFINHIVEKTNQWKAGDPMDVSVHMGTLINENAAICVENAVQDAVIHGARVLTGHQRTGALYTPTVLDHVKPEMMVVREETFGPVSPIMSFDNIDEAIALANSTKFGLSSGVCTNRMDYITRFVKELNVGTVNIWEVPGYRMELTPFGGVKDSGLGHKEGVQESIKAFSNQKLFTIPWM